MSEWTKTPPKSPGYYWCRRDSDPFPLELHADGEWAFDWPMSQDELARLGYEWWSTPIEPPKTGNAASAVPP